jgi:hypothetical protein
MFCVNFEFRFHFGIIKINKPKNAIVGLFVVCYMGFNASSNSKFRIARVTFGALNFGNTAPSKQQTRMAAAAFNHDIPDYPRAKSISFGVWGSHKKKICCIDFQESSLRVV